MKNALYILLVALFSAMATATSFAQDTIHYSRMAYESAHPVKHIISFNNYGPSGTLYPSGITVPTPFGDVAFEPLPDTRRLEIIDANSFGFAGSGNLVLFALDADFNQDSMLITLPPNTFSFGTDLISPSPSVPEPYQFTLFSGSNVLATLVAPSISGSYTFIGYDSETDPITSIAIQITSTSGNPGPVLDNFTIVPEPSTTWLIGIGAAIALLVARRRLRA